MSSPLLSSNRILCLGDSLTWGYFNNGTQHAPYGDFLNKFLVKQRPNLPWSVDIHGFNGESSSTLGGRLTTLLNKSISKKNKTKYGLACVMCGTNDLGDSLTADEIVGYLRGIYEQLLTYNPTIQLLVLGIPTMVWKKEWANLPGSLPPNVRP